MSTATHCSLLSWRCSSRTPSTKKPNLLCSTQLSWGGGWLVAMSGLKWAKSRYFARYFFSGQMDFCWFFEQEVGGSSPRVGNFLVTVPLFFFSEKKIGPSEKIIKIATLTPHPPGWSRRWFWFLTLSSMLLSILALRLPLGEIKSTTSRRRWAGGVTSLLGLCSLFDRLARSLEEPSRNPCPGGKGVHDWQVRLGSCVANGLFGLSFRFPEPRFIECDENGSQARFLLAKVNPSSKHQANPLTTPPSYEHHADHFEM